MIENPVLFQNEEDPSNPVEAFNEEDLFTEKLIKSWFDECMGKMFNYHIIGLAIIGNLLLEISPFFVLIYLIIYDCLEYTFQFKALQSEDK